MTAAEFNRLVEQPSLLKDVSTDALRDLVKRYPFFASAHLLLLKKYQIEKHPDFDSRLALTAAYANDRKALYRLLYDDGKFKIAEEATTAVGTQEQRVGTEILLGNESGAFSDYTPKNQVAEVETFESIDFVKTGWAEGLQTLENENTGSLSKALQEQFELANEKAGGGSDVVHDFDNLEEENENELLEEKIESELESTKALEEAVENAVEENNYNEFASLSSSAAETTHRFDELPEQNEDELLEEDLDVELESTKALEDAIEHAIVEPDYNELSQTVGNNGTSESYQFEDKVIADKPAGEETIQKPVENVPSVDVPEQQREIPAQPLEYSNVEHEESPSSKEEITTQPQEADKESVAEAVNNFEPSSELAELLYSEDEKSTDNGRDEEAIGIQSDTEYITEESQPQHNLSGSHQADETSREESGIGEAAMEEVIEEANLPTSVEEHEVKPEEFEAANTEYVAENEILQENVATSLTPELTPRQEIEAPMAEEDLVGTTHHKISHETEASYRTDEGKSGTVAATHQGVQTEGTKTFTDWLKLFRKTEDNRHQTTDRANDSSEISSQKTNVDPGYSRTDYNEVEKQRPKSEHLSDEHDDDLYDREWQARKLEMESWTAGLPDELKAIDQFVSENTGNNSHQPVLSVAELAERSLEVNDSFLTETMARVYASQGKYKKAAEVVEKLMLRNPAKRLYFADLLEEFKKKITS